LPFQNTELNLWRSRTASPSRGRRTGEQRKSIAPRKTGSSRNVQTSESSRTRTGPPRSSAGKRSRGLPDQAPQEGLRGQAAQLRRSHRNHLLSCSLKCGACDAIGPREREGQRLLRMPQRFATCLRECSTCTAKACRWARKPWSVGAAEAGTKSMSTTRSFGRDNASGCPRMQKLEEGGRS
jgi:hypothetical protein